ncbi:MAG: hypothetical protein WCF78_03900 [archaeon]
MGLGNYRLKLGTNRFNKKIKKVNEKTSEKYEDRKKESTIALREIKSKRTWIVQESRKINGVLHNLSKNKQKLYKLLQETQEKINKVSIKYNKQITDANQNIRQSTEYKKYIEFKRREDAIKNQIKKIDDEILSLMAYLKEDLITKEDLKGSYSNLFKKLSIIKKNK